MMVRPFCKDDWGDVLRKIVFIGYPCQVTAVRRLKALIAYLEEHYPGKAITWPREYPPLAGLQWAKDIELLIGVFCQAGTYLPGVAKVLARNKIDIRKASGLEIENDGIRFTMDGENQVIRLNGEEARKKAMPGCTVCSDYTALLADISVDMNKTTPDGIVIPRTGVGKVLFAAALDSRLFRKMTGGDAGSTIVDREQAKARRSVENTGKYKEKLPPAFYTDISFDVEAGIYDSLLQDFYLVKDLIKNDLCVLCGMCEAICPLGSMVLDGKQPQFNNRCSDKICGLCFTTCPQNFVMQGIEQNRLMRDLKVFAPTDPVDVIQVRAEGAENILYALVRHCLGQGGMTGAMVLHHWNTRSIIRALADIPCKLLKDYVRDK